MKMSVIGDINTLPDEIVLSIFKLLPLQTLLTCENVCQRWRKLSHDLSIWRDMLIVYSGNSNAKLNNSISIIRSHGQWISCIRFQYIDNYTHTRALLQNCENIISLELVMCNLVKDFVEDIKKWPKLKKLNLKNSMLYPRDADALIDFKYFKELNYIDLTDFGISSTNCNDLVACTHLSHIYLNKIQTLSLSNVKDLIKSKLSILRSFHIYGGHSVDDTCLYYLSQCPNLRDLAITRCEQLTDRGLLELTNLKQLNQLQLWNNSIFTELALITMLGESNLFYLNSLSFSRIYNMSPVVVDIISENYKNLKFLALYQCPKIINTSYEKQLKVKFRNIDVVLF